MSLMAKYARILWPTPTDDDVGKRNRAVAKVQASISALTNTLDCLRLAASLADGFQNDVLSEEFAGTVEKAIVDTGSEAFVREGREIEIMVVGSVAILDLLRSSVVHPRGWNAIDQVAAGLWSALSFQPTSPKEAIEALRQEIVDAAYSRARKVAEASRTRLDVPEVGLLTIPESQPNSSRANAAFKKAAEPLVHALRENAELDREEIDFLWWALADWCDALDCALEGLPELKRAVACGVAGGQKLRRLPSSGHRNVVLRHITSAERATLIALRDAVGDDAHALLSTLDTHALAQLAPVFPLLSSLAQAANPSGSDIERDSREWGGRAFLESGIAHLAFGKS